MIQRRYDVIRDNYRKYVHEALVLFRLDLASLKAVFVNYERLLVSSRLG